MVLSTVPSSMLTRPSSSRRALVAALEDGDQLLVRRAVGLCPCGAERRTVDDPLHDQVDEPVAAGRERQHR